jgi:hypothetical protein
MEVDVIAIGQRTAQDEDYSRMVRSRNGIFVRVTNPEEAGRGAEEYLRSLSESRSPELEVIGQASSYRLHDRQSITLSPGLYSLVLPKGRGGDSAKRTIEGVDISPGVTTEVEMDALGPKVHIEKHP